MSLMMQILRRTLDHFLQDIYQSSATGDGYAEFKTNVQNSLDIWVSDNLSELSIDVARTYGTHFCDIL
jgi:hypothetical protein